MKIVETRHDTAANWTALNPVLANEETGYEDDTGKFKVGNGTAAWNALSYSLPTGLGAPSQGTAPDSDKLDGLDSSAFLRVNAKAADSDKLDGLDSSAFLLAGAKAADSELLDGLDSTAFRLAFAATESVVTDYSPPTGNTPPMSYPSRISRGGSNPATAGWPNNEWGHFIMEREGTDSIQQWFSLQSSAAYVRRSISNPANVWSAWTRMDRPDAETLDGIDSGTFMRRVAPSATQNIPTLMDVVGDGSVSSVNRHFSTGIYNIAGTNSKGPWGDADGRWWWLQVLAHAYGTTWQRQIAYDMTGGSDTFYTRRLSGNDPTVAGNWTAWVAK